MLIKFKGKSAAKNIKKRLRHIKKILVKEVTVQDTKIRKKSK